MSDESVMAAMKADLMTVNQARKRVGNGPIKGGDVLFSQMENMVVSMSELYDLLGEERRRREAGELGEDERLVILNSGEAVVRKKQERESDNGAREVAVPKRRRLWRKS